MGLIILGRGYNGYSAESAKLVPETFHFTIGNDLVGFILYTRKLQSSQNVMASVGGFANVSNYRNISALCISR